MLEVTFLHYYYEDNISIISTVVAMDLNWKS